MEKSAIVMIGAGPAGFAAAQRLREEGYDDRLVLIGREETLPYERPALSKDLLTGESSAEGILLRPAEWFHDNEIDLRLGRSATIDPSSRVVLCGSDVIPARSVLLATGGRPRQPFGPASKRVLYLRDMNDARSIREHVVNSEHLIVVGAGFIGAEVAASARSVGVQVTMLEALDLPMSRALGADVARVYADIHVEEGVQLRLGEGVTGIEEQADCVIVRTTKGVEISGEAVVIGVGIEPNVEIAEDAGIHVDNGILVDEYCRTDVPNIFAAGDVANHKHPLYGRHVRVEHFSNALKQGAAAAMTMVGTARPYEEPHWFWSDQYEYNLQSAGIPEGWDGVVIRGSLEKRDFVAFYMKQGFVVAAIGINRGRDIRRSLTLIKNHVAVDATVLSNEDADLRKLARSQ